MSAVPERPASEPVDNRRVRFHLAGFHPDGTPLVRVEDEAGQQVVHDRQGTHTYRDQGYSAQHSAHLLVCEEHGCRMIANTDENKVRRRGGKVPTGVPPEHPKPPVGGSDPVCATCGFMGCHAASCPRIRSRR